MPDSACDKCHRPLRIDFYGEVLEGCIHCNVKTLLVVFGAKSPRKRGEG